MILLSWAHLTGMTELVLTVLFLFSEHRVEPSSAIGSHDAAMKRFRTVYRIPADVIIERPKSNEIPVLNPDNVNRISICI